MRADKFFAEKFGSRTKAKEALLRGEVLLEGRAVKPDDEAEAGKNYVFLESDAFLSNGGKKLERGLSAFHVDLQGQVFADLGASTGGFTDCLLRRGACRVYAVDVGESQLSPQLALDPRVTVMDKTNARYLTAENFPEPIDGVVADLSFISLRLVLPAIASILPQNGQCFVLFKPQFECEGQGLKPNGILPKTRHEALLSRFYGDCVLQSLAPRGVVNAPIVAGKNLEYIVWMQKGGEAIPRRDFIDMSKKIF